MVATGTPRVPILEFPTDRIVGTLDWNGSWTDERGPDGTAPPRQARACKTSRSALTNSSGCAPASPELMSGELAPGDRSTTSCRRPDAALALVAAERSRRIVRRNRSFDLNKRTGSVQLIPARPDVAWLPGLS